MQIADSNGMEVSAFHAWLRRQGLSPRTAQLYVRIVRRAAAQAADLGTTLEELDLPELDDLVALWHLSYATRSQLRCALARYWQASGRTNPPLAAIRVPKQPRLRCRAVDELAAVRLSRAAQADGGPDGLAVLLGLYGALRRAEMATLRWDAIDLVAGRLTILGKGDRTRTFPLHPVLLAALSSTARRGPFVFPGAGGAGHAATATIWHRVRRLAVEAGMPTVTPHILRHTALATALDRTRDLRAVQDFAGHAKPETTAGYTRTTAKRLTAVVMAIDYEAAAAEAATA